MVESVLFMATFMAELLATGGKEIARARFTALPRCFRLLAKP